MATTRMRESFSLRLKDRQRTFIERKAEVLECGLGEALRIIIDEAMAKAGAIE